jgi:hypothetical protein
MIVRLTGLNRSKVIGICHCDPAVSWGKKHCLFSSHIVYLQDEYPHRHVRLGSKARKWHWSSEYVSWTSTWQLWYQNPNSLQPGRTKTTKTVQCSLTAWLRHGSTTKVNRISETVQSYHSQKRALTNYFEVSEKDIQGTSSEWWRLSCVLKPC